MILVVYFLVIFLASVSGAVAGVGGGVIIKQLLDVVGYHSPVDIAFYASAAIFTMAIVSMLKQARAGFTFNYRIVLSISLGSLLGGLFGERVFLSVLGILNEGYVKALQAILLAVTLLLILWYENHKDKVRHFHVKNTVVIFLIGFFLGSFSIFLGIGGGPLNLSLLTLMFSFSMKEAVVYSIATVFFSQISKLGSVALSGALFQYSLSFVLVVILSAIVGGYVGTLINQKLSGKSISAIFQLLVVFLLFVSLYNTYTGLR